MPSGDHLGSESWPDCVSWIEGCSVAVEPEIGAENLLIPVGAVGGEDYGIAIGREFDAAEADGVEEVVERQFGLALSQDWEGTAQDHRNHARDTLDSHRPPREKGLYNAGFGESKFVTGSRDAMKNPHNRDEHYN